MSDFIGVNLRAALRMFWDAGFMTSADLVQARDRIMTIKQRAQGYWAAADISAAIDAAKQGDLQ